MRRLDTICLAMACLLVSACQGRPKGPTLVPTVILPPASPSPTDTVGGSALLRVILTPAEQALPAGASASFSARIAGWSTVLGVPWWSVQRLPQGMQAEFVTQASLSEIILVVLTTCPLEPGRHAFTVQATISGTVFSAEASLRVTERPQESQPGTLQGTFTANTISVRRGGPSTEQYGPFQILQFCAGTQPRMLRVAVQSATSDVGTPLTEPPRFAVFRLLLWPPPSHLQTMSGSYVANAVEEAQSSNGGLEWSIRDGAYCLVFLRSPLEMSLPAEKRPAKVTYTLQITP